MPTAYVEPQQYTLYSHEVRTLPFDTANLLETGETPLSPTARLIDLNNNTSYPAGLRTPAATASGNRVIQRVGGLIGGHDYLLEVDFQTATATTTGTIWTMPLRLVCPR